MNHIRARSNSLVVRLLWSLALVSFLVSSVYPADLGSYRAGIGVSRAPQLVYATEHYGRFINTGLQIAVPLVLRDREGIVELLKVGVAVTVATHGAKWALNDVTIMGTRLGERPFSHTSSNNMPSGHSSMASSAAYFLCRRYSWKFLLISLPILLLTMFTRVSMDKHTVSAVIAGALVGMLVTAIFTSRYRKPDEQASGNATG